MTEACTLSVAIMHAPWSKPRAARVEALAASVGPAHIVHAVRGAGVWDTARRAWEWGAGDGASHHLVLQDDAIPCAGFRDRVLEAIAARPRHVVTLYTHRAQQVAAARASGRAWCWGPDAAYGLAILMPRERVADFLAWERASVRPEYPHDDNRLTLWCRSTGEGVWVTCPQLVDHARLPSTLAHSWPGGAPWFEPLPGAIDWTAGTADPVRIPANVRAHVALIDPSEARRWPIARPQ